jgi:hypothetical protein
MQPLGGSAAATEPPKRCPLPLTPAADDTALRINEIVSAQQAVNDPVPQRLLHQREREAIPVFHPDRLEHRGVKPRVFTHELQRPPRCPRDVVGIR